MENAKETIARRKEKILAAMQDFLTGREIVKSLELPWIKDIPQRILAYSAGGKMLRGNLVLLGCECAQKELPDNSPAYKVAAAFELFQSGILMHDDVIDEDDLRRGLPSAHRAMEADFMANMPRPAAMGEKMAICLGDILLMLTYALLASCGAEAQKTISLVSLWGREFAHVGAAEMEDTYLSCIGEFPEEERILNLYLGKTAGYTFLVPLLSGAILGSADEKTKKALTDYALSLGVLFQIKDDELGLFGQAKTLGKPIGSDIKEGKKTIFWQKLMQKSQPETRQELSQIFGNKNCTEGDIEKVRRCLEASGVRQEVASLCQALAQEAATALAPLPESPAKSVLAWLIEKSMTRTA